MLAKIFVILFLFGVAYADDPTFALPPQWDASIMMTSTPSDFPIPIPGHVWYDSPDQLYRLDIDVMGMQFETIIDFNQMVYATITKMNGETNCNLNLMDTSAITNPNAFTPRYHGRDSQNNCNIFKLTNPDNPNDPSYVEFCITSNQLLLYIKIYTNDGPDSPKETDINFSNHRIGQAPSGTFTIPSDCPLVSDGNNNGNDNGNGNDYGNGYAIARRNRRMKRMVKKSQSTFRVMRQFADVVKFIKTK